MRTRMWPQYTIAAAVIGCSLVLLGALTFAITGFEWSTRGRTLQVEFHDATGIKLHSPVRYAGAVAGSVVGVRYLTFEERRRTANNRNAVRVKIRLNEDVPPLPSDVMATLASETLLGDKFVALSAGSPHAQPLPEDAIVQGHEPLGFDALAKSAQGAIETVTQILSKLNTDYPTLIPRLADLLAQVQGLVGQGSNFVTDADSAVTNVNGVIARLHNDYGDLIPKLSSLVSQAKSIATNADNAMLQVGVLVNRTDLLVKNNEGDLAKILDELRVVSQNLKVISTYSKALTSSLGEKPSRLIWGREKTGLPSEEQILQSSEPVPIAPSPK